MNTGHPCFCNDRDDDAYLIGVASGEAKEAMASPKCLKNEVILCFERRFSRQNSVVRVKSNILGPPKFLGWLRHWPT